MTDWTGGCACGAVRYRLASDPVDAGWCHCRTCQLNSGSPAMAFASSETGHRLFCARCGTPLLMRDNDSVGTADFSLATLDEPARIVPGFHIYYARHIPWAPAADRTPRYARSRSEGAILQQSQQQQQ